MSAFDPTKPFGTVRGVPGAKYEQDGKLFNARLEQVDANGALLKPAKAPESKPSPAAPAPVKKSRSSSKSKAEPQGVKSMAELAAEEGDK